MHERANQTKIPNTPIPAPHTKSRAGWIAGAFVALIALSITLLYVRHHPAAVITEASASIVPAPVDHIGKFEPTKSNPQPAPSAAPAGMVWIPGGEFSMGAQDPPGMDDVA